MHWLLWIAIVYACGYLYCFARLRSDFSWKQRALLSLIWFIILTERS